MRYAPVFGGERRPDLVEAIGGELRRKMSALLLYPLDEEDSALIGEAFGRSGWICDKDETSVNWVADVAGGWGCGSFCFFVKLGVRELFFNP